MEIYTAIRKSAMQLKRFAHPLGIVVFVSLVCAAPLLWSGFPPSWHDGPIHLRWSHHAATQFWNGTVYPRYFPELNYNFGSPSFFFYPPISTLASVLFWPLAPEVGRDWYTLGWSAALGLLLSGVFMWLFLCAVAQNRWAAAIGSVLYVVAPYHLGIDLLARGANAECWAFAFMPLVLLSFHRLGRNSEPSRHWISHSILPSNPTIWASLSLAALFCCHVLTALVFAPIALAYAWSLGRAAFGRAVVAGHWAVLVSAAYLLPTMLYAPYISGSNNPVHMGEYFHRSFFFPSFQFSQPMLTSGPFERLLLFSFVGVAVILASSFCWLLVPTGDKEHRRMMLLCFVLLQLCLCMMLPVSEPIYAFVGPLRRLQFTWRFLSPATFVGSVLVTLFVSGREKRLWQWPMVAIVIATSLYTSWSVNSDLYRWNYLTENGTWRKDRPSIEFNALDALGEYVPVDANLQAARKVFSDATNASPLHFRIVSGAGKVSIRKASARRFTVESDSEEGLNVVLHQFWFPGWLAKETASRDVVPVTRQAESGLLSIAIRPGRRTTNLCLTMLWPEAVGTTLSALAAAWFLGMVVGRYFRRKSIRETNQPTG
jgi:hypothetical protein